MAKTTSGGNFWRGTLSLSYLLSIVTGGAYCQNTTWPYQTFQTTNFTPPELAITKQGSQAPGLLFIDQAGPQAQERAPLIMTDDNELVWQGPTSQTFNFGAQTYKGVPVITYWNGTIFPEPIGHGYGTVHILNQSYHEIATVSLADNFTTMNGAHYPSGIDLHEIYITPNNTMLVTANNVTTTDLTTLGGLTMGYVVDGLVYEIDIATNEVLFR